MSLIVRPQPAQEPVPLLTTDEITLRALKNEHARLSRLAAKAKADADEYCGAGSEYQAVYKEFIQIVDARDYGPEATKRLADLDRRRNRVDRIRKKDLLALLDRQHEAEWERDVAAEALEGLKFRLSLQRRR